MTNRIKSIVLLGLLPLLSSCTKSFLEAKPSTTIITPGKLSELQGMLENENAMNIATPSLPLLAVDDYVFKDYASWQAAYTITERNSYIWAKDIYEGTPQVWDWGYPYAGIFYCNSVLDILPSIPLTAENSKQYRTVKGWALFSRAYFLFDLARNFAPAYDPATAATDMGVPIRLTPAVDELAPRSSVAETYARILKDLSESAALLDTTLPANNNRPSRAAAYALFARIYLSMREYNKAELYADSSLALHNKLLDYNTLSKTATNPFPLASALINEEVIFSTGALVDVYTTVSPGSFNTNITINPDLINLYNPKDLRLSIYFGTSTVGTLYPKRGYFVRPTAFTGLANDEIYLIKAECLARRNEVTQAMLVLNTLLKMRFAPADFVNQTAVDKTDALNKVLTERRKELVWRTLRWSDLKRLNKEGANITLTRVLNGVTYTLPPNDPRYVFPIPDDEISRSGIQQNAR